MLLLGLALCTNPGTGCSTDPEQPCDQTIAWDAVTPQPDTYEVGRGGETCLVVPGDRTTVDLTGTSCLNDRERMTVQVRACNGTACGGWSNPVDFDAVSCLEMTCEKLRPDDVFCTQTAACERPCCVGSAHYLPAVWPVCE